MIAALMLSAAHAQSQTPIRIQYNTTSAKVTVPAHINDVTYTVNGANVVVNSDTKDTESSSTAVTN